MKKLIFKFVTALSVALGVCLASQATESRFYNAGPVGILSECYSGDYMVSLRNNTGLLQTCNLDCKHIISTDRFTVTLQPFGVTDVYGTHGKATCDLRCNNYYGPFAFSFRTPRCGILQN